MIQPSARGEHRTLGAQGSRVSGIRAVVAGLMGVALAFGTVASAHGEVARATAPTSPVSPAKGPIAGGTEVSVCGIDTSSIPRFTQIEADFRHSVALASDGRVYSAGSNFFGQLGTGTTGDSSDVFVPVETAGTPMAGKTITQVAAGAFHSVALASDGSMYSWGYGANWQLGSGRADIEPKPVRVVIAGTPLAGKEIAQISASSDNTMILTTDGGLYGWGNNEHGELGIGSTDPQLTAVPVKTAGTPMEGKRITQIAMGGMSMTALASDGSVYAWGSHDWGQLGNGKPWGYQKRELSPGLVVTAGTPMAGKKITKIVAGWAHLLAVSDEGLVYSWGFNDLGQLGVGSSNHNDARSLPSAVVVAGTPMEGKRITDVAIESEHSVALADDGSLYTWGYDITETPQDPPRPTALNKPALVDPEGTPFEGKEITGISTASHSTFVFTEGGDVAAWGRNNEGELGIGETPGGQATPIVVNDVLLPAVGVSFGGAEATGVDLSALRGSGCVTAATPAHAAGNVDVEVRFDHTLVKSDTAAFRYTQPESVSYLPNGGTGAVEPGAGVNGEDFTVAGNGFTRTGYSFGGWNTAQNGSGTGLAAGASTVLPVGGLRLFAQWIADPATLAFDSNGGTGSMAPVAAVTDAVVNAGENAFDRAGYTFLAWNTAPDGSGMSYGANGSLSIPAGGVTLYAQWTANPAALTYLPNGGTGTIEPTTGNTDDPVTVAENAFTRAGYSFVGWNTAADGSGDQIAGGDPFTLRAGNVQLYAQWDPDPAALAYDANGGAGSVPGYGGVTDEAVTVRSNDFTRDGHSFVGWNTAADGSGDEHAARDQFVLPAGGATLYAQWKLNEYSVTFDARGGSTVSPARVLHGDPVDEPEAPVQAGHTFTGWSTDKTELQSYAFGAAVTEDLVLYAVWSSDVVPVAPTLGRGTVPDAGKVGTPFRGALAVAGTESPSLTVTQGKLPDGLALAGDARGSASAGGFVSALDAPGSISGTPTKAGTYAFTVTATNATGSVELPLTITISGGDGTETPGTGKPDDTTTPPSGRPGSGDQQGGAAPLATTGGNNRLGDPVLLGSAALAMLLGAAALIGARRRRSSM